MSSPVLQDEADATEMDDNPVPPYFKVIYLSHSFLSTLPQHTTATTTTPTMHTQNARQKKQF
jgi:hypothetical protein